MDSGVGFVVGYQWNMDVRQGVVIENRSQLVLNQVGF